MLSGHRRWRGGRRGDGRGGRGESEGTSRFLCVARGFVVRAVGARCVGFGWGVVEISRIYGIGGVLWCTLSARELESRSAGGSRARHAWARD